MTQPTITMPTYDPGTVILVGPELAKQWLDMNVRNRSLRRHHVNAYASDMATGRWQFAGDPIRFDRDGHLIDGQHRLAALVTADVVLPFVVQHGLDPASQAVMDSNIKRTTADALALLGQRNTSALAAAIKFVVLWDTGRVASTGKAGMVTTAQQIEFLDANPDMLRAVDMAASFRRRIPVPVSVMAVAWFKFARIDTADTHAFFTALANLDLSGPGDPKRALVARLQTVASNRERVAQAAYLSMLVRTWNAVREGRTLSKLPILSRNGVIEVPAPR